MKIQQNQISNYINTKVNSQVTTPKTSFNGQEKRIDELFSANINGVSQVNSNLPIGYTKIAEITVPNCEEKASLFKLANGQKVVILPKQGPTYVKTTFNVGSMNEPDNKRGISHFIEHIKSQYTN